MSLFCTPKKGGELDEGWIYSRLHRRSEHNSTRNPTETVLDRYFVSAKYYDGWGIGRADEKYMVQCEVYASNALKMKSWVPAKVWYEDQGNGEFVVTGVQIDGTQYEVKP